MKSTMKSAFAFIAVAMMIMVAVVPMVSVFTEDSSAETQTKVDPSTDVNVIELKVSVKDGTIVKIAYGSYSFTAVSASGTGIATFKIREAKVDSLTISVVDAKGVADSNYAAVTLTNLIAGKTYGATLKAGYDIWYAKFQFANNEDIKATYIGTAATITSNYEVYSDAATTTMISSGTFVVDPVNYIATFLVPAGTTGNVYVKVTSFSCSTVSGISFDTKPITVSSAGSVSAPNAFKAQQSIMIIVPNIAMTSDVTVSNVVEKHTVSSGTAPADTTFTAIKATMNNSPAAGVDKNAYFIGIVGTTSSVTNTYTMDLTAGGSATGVALTYSGTTVTTATYTLPANAFFGTVKMGAYAQAGALSAKIVDNAATPVTLATVSSVAVDAKGNFFTFLTYAEGTPANLTEITFVTTVGSTSFSIADMSYTTKGTSAAISVPVTGYSKVTGTVFKLADSTGAATGSNIEGKELTITGAKTFGSLVTTSSGFDFYAEKGKNIIISAANAELYGNVSVVPGTSSTDLTITMKAQTLTLKVADALGKALNGATVKLTDGTVDIATFSAGTVAGTYKAEIRGDLAVSGLKVYIEKPDGYTYANTTMATATAFVEGSTYSALEATYTIALYNYDGTDFSATSGTNYNVYNAKAYKNTAGSVVYVYDGVKDKITATSGAFIAKASSVAVKESEIGVTPVSVVVMVKTASLNGAIFKDVYLVNADSKGKVSITASRDSLTGTLYRNDGVTPIAGVKVVLNDGSNDVTGSETYTQADGTFTLYSKAAITADYKVKFENIPGYTFTSTGYAAATGSGATLVKVVKYAAATSAYTVSLTDADGEEIMLADSAKFKVGGVEFTTVNGTNTATGTANWTALTEELAVSDLDTSGIKDATKRSFGKITLTAAQLASGKVDLVSNQKTYAFAVTDSEEVGLNNVEIKFYKYSGDYPVELTERSVKTKAVLGVDGVASILLPFADETDLKTVYGYKAVGAEADSSAGYAATIDYAFSLDVTKITAAENIVKSTSALKTVYIQDAAGVAIKATPNVIVNKVGATSGPADTPGVGYFTFVATKDVKYTYTIGEITTDKLTKYTFTPAIADDKGIVKAKEETITGSVTDAAGNYFNRAVEVKAYSDAAATTQIGTTGKQGSSDGSYSIVAEKSKIVCYVAEDSTSTGGAVKFTFDKSETADIKANETFVPMVFETANGVTATDVSVSALDTYNDLGVKGSATVQTVNGVSGVIIDADKVAYLSYTFNADAKYFAKGTYESKDGKFVSNKAEYTGNLGTAVGTASYVIYKGSEVVERKTLDTEISGTKYTIIVDTTLGDKIVVTNTVTTGTGEAAVTKTYSAVMNNTSKVIDLVEVVSPTTLKISIAEKNAAYITCDGVSADGKYVYLLAEKSYTKQVMGSTSAGSDGHDLAEKFKFDGWYVNGEKVSSEVSYTADNTEGNIVAAYYVFDGYYETNKPVEKSEGNNSSVMIIGIAAVIIALIAVVYAVIQKKQ